MDFEEFYKVYGKGFDDAVLGKVRDIPDTQEKIYSMGYNDGLINLKIHPNTIKLMYDFSIRKKRG